MTVPVRSDRCSARGVRISIAVVKLSVDRMVESSGAEEPQKTWVSASLHESTCFCWRYCTALVTTLAAAFTTSI